MNAANKSEISKSTAGSHKNPPAHDPRAIANYFLDKVINADLSKETRQRITPLSLQKLIYIANALHFTEHQHPLVNDTPKVGKYDPYFPILREALSFFGGGRITKKITEGTGEDVFRANRTSPSIKGEFTPMQAILLDELWDVFESLEFDCTRLTYLTGGDAKEFAKLKSMIGLDGEISNTVIKRLIVSKLANSCESYNQRDTGKCAA